MEQEIVRSLSAYTPASFARLMSHSLRFLKLEREHIDQVSGGTCLLRVVTRGREVGFTSVKVSCSRGLLLPGLLCRWC